MQKRKLQTLVLFSLAVFSFTAYIPQAHARVDVRSNIHVETRDSDGNENSSSRSEVNVYHEIRGESSSSFHFSTSSQSGSLHVNISDTGSRRDIDVDRDHEIPTTIEPVQPIISDSRGFSNNPSSPSPSLGTTTITVTTSGGTSTILTLPIREHTWGGTLSVGTRNARAIEVIKNIAGLFDPVHGELLRLLILFA